MKLAMLSIAYYINDCFYVIDFVSFTIKFCLNVKYYNGKSA